MEDWYGLEDAKQTWREHPEMPGYCTIDMNGSVLTPKVAQMANAITEEFGECHIRNAYSNGCPILKESNA